MKVAGPALWRPRRESGRVGKVEGKVEIKKGQKRRERRLFLKAEVDCNSTAAVMCQVRMALAGRAKPGRLINRPPRTTEDAGSHIL